MSSGGFLGWAEAARAALFDTPQVVHRRKERNRARMGEVQRTQLMKAKRSEVDMRRNIADMYAHKKRLEADLETYKQQGEMQMFMMAGGEIDKLVRRIDVASANLRRLQSTIESWEERASTVELANLTKELHDASHQLGVPIVDEMDEIEDAVGDDLLVDDQVRDVNALMDDARERRDEAYDEQRAAQGASTNKWAQQWEAAQAERSSAGMLGVSDAISAAPSVNLARRERAVASGGGGGGGSASAGGADAEFEDAEFEQLIQASLSESNGGGSGKKNLRF
jgi:hypothetical protein